MFGCADCGPCSGCKNLKGVGAAAVRRKVVALAGNPNSGKTTIFNALTGLRQKIGNYPGVTVEKRVGLCRVGPGEAVDVIDLPGTYSLISRSPDERVTMEVLRGLRSDTPTPDAIVAVLDASNLQRNLYLVSQLIELQRPLVIALNMMDVAQQRGVAIDPARLERALGVPVVAVVGSKKTGIEDLKEALSRARRAPMPDWPLPPAMKREISVLAGLLAVGADQAGSENLTGGDGLSALAERLLIGDDAHDALAAASRPAVAVGLAAASARLHAHGIDAMQADIEAHYCWIESLTSPSEPPAAVSAGPGGSPASTRADATEWIDNILIHKVWGLLIFVVVMGSLFTAIFWIAAPIQKLLSSSVALAGSALAARLPEGAWRSLIDDGIFAGVGSVVVFIPQIALLFLFLALLEDSGYLARAAFLMDRLLARVGLHGKSFVPLLSGFACAIPGVMATRTIENRKDRLATILVLPFMTCSARLPVYTLLVGTFFGAYSAFVQAGIMLLLYAGGILAAAGAAWAFKHTLLKGAGTAFILELPSYKRPQTRLVLRQMWCNSSKFLTKAGSTILCLCVLLWALSYYPRLPMTEAARYREPKALASAQLSYSLMGRIGQGIEPLIRPLGFDWKIGVACIGAFSAREIFVSTLAIVYGAGEDGTPMDLGKAMREDLRPDGSPVWTPLVASGVLLWFVLAMQCLSTVLIVKVETGGWKWPLFLLTYMNALAYLSCLLLHQAGSLVL